MMNKFLPDSAFLFIKSILNKIKKSKLATLALLCVLGQGLYILLPGLLGILIDKVFVQNRWSVQWLILFPSIWFISVVFNSFGKFNISSVTQDVRKISKEVIFQHIINLPNSVYVGRDAGEVEHLMQELSFNSRYFFNESFPFFIRTIVTLIVSVLIVGYSSLELIFIFIGWTCLFIPISYFTAKKSIKYVSESLLGSAEVSAASVEVIENHELIPAFGTENFETYRFDQILEKERNCYNKAQRKIDTTDFFQRLLQISLPISIAFLNNLDAIQIKTEFYRCDEIPKQYEKLCPVEGDYCTLIFLEGWPQGREVYVTEIEGTVLKKKKNLGSFKGDAFFCFDSKGYIPGCPIKLDFKDSKKLKKEIIFVPNRILVKSINDKAQIEATILSANPCSYRIEFTGFNEKENIFIKSSSYNEQIEMNPQIDKESSILIMPGVINKDGGIGRLSFRRPSGEILKMELPWGWEWMKYSLYYDEKGKIKSIVDQEGFLKENPKIAEYFNSIR